jgi:hypothetical protein
MVRRVWTKQSYWPRASEKDGVTGARTWPLPSNLAGLDAGGADVQALGAARDSGPHALDIRIPASIGLLLRPGHVVAEARSFPADVTYGSHWSSLPLDCDLGPPRGNREIVPERFDR